MYNNEEELLTARFLELYDVVDYFIIIESPITFQGNPKPLNFQREVCRKFGGFANKVVHVVVNLSTDNKVISTWKREAASRVGACKAMRARANLACA